MSRNHKIRVLEHQLHQAKEALVIHEQIAREAMTAVMEQANEITAALATDLTTALNLLAQFKPPSNVVLALLQMEIAKQDGDGIDPQQFRWEGRSEEGMLFEAAGMVRLLISRRAEPATPFDIDHAPEIATFLEKLNELKERNREQRGEPGDCAAGEGGIDETGSASAEGQGVGVPLPSA
jgi:hypothetical protein